jgi:hypothetical protein
MTCLTRSPAVRCVRGFVLGRLLRELGGSALEAAAIRISFQVIVLVAEPTYTQPSVPWSNALSSPALQSSFANESCWAACRSDRIIIFRHRCVRPIRGPSLATYRRQISKVTGKPGKTRGNLLGNIRRAEIIQPSPDRLLVWLLFAILLAPFGHVLFQLRPGQELAAPRGSDNLTLKGSP